MSQRGLNQNDTDAVLAEQRAELDQRGRVVGAEFSITVAASPKSHLKRQIKCGLAPDIDVFSINYWMERPK
jgi:hypothetical protein